MRNITIVAVLIPFLACPARADLILAVDYSDSPPFASATGTFGYSFTIGSTDLTIDALAVTTAISSDAHEVRIWKDGTTTNVASASINGNTDPVSSTAHPYYYHAITPVTLQANTTYDIAVDLNDGGHFVYYDATGVSNNADVTFGSARSASTTGAFPTGDSFGNGPYFGPSFEAAVPEPTSFLLVGVAVSGLTLGAWRWNRKKGAPAADA